jgi:thiol-disulfide isomerase/thioredoxin
LSITALLVSLSTACIATAQAVPDNSPQLPADNTPNPAPASLPVPPASIPTDRPGVIYKEAMHPLEVVRQSLDNWSDSELAALHLGMQMAREACDKMNPEDFNNDDLYDLAHLCAFGQDWNPANTAAQRYIAGKAPEHRAQAYAISVGAFVHLNAVDLALGTTQEMLEREPYDAEVAYTLRYMKDELETKGNPKALELAAEEHPKIIDALSKGTPLKAAHGDAMVSTGLLYEMAIEAAFFARYAGDDAQAAALLGDVERALPQNAVVTAEDRQEIDGVNLQYHLLGTSLGHIPVIRSSKSPSAKTQIGPNFGAATVLVVFPDWCVQCKKMLPEMARFSSANAEKPIYTYGLIFSQNGEKTATIPQKEPLGADTIEISQETARGFGITDYPLGIVVDHAGVIHFIGVLPSDAFNDDGYVGKILTRIVGTQLKPPATGPGRD